MDGSPKGVLVGLTGGIACGKSTVGGFLKEAGWDVEDADRLAHEAMAPDGAAYADIVERFGKEILKNDGTIDRAALGKRVFEQADERKALNGLVHPHVQQARAAWQDRVRRENRPAAMIIPLLFEVGATDGWDAIVCVAASENIAMDRLRARGLSDEEARQRLAAQWPVAQKKEQADYIFENNGSLGALKAQVMKWSKDFLKKENADYAG